MGSYSSSSTSSDSLNGLKFGQKIYFEDVGIGIQAKSGGGSSSADVPPPSPAKKGRCGGGVQGGQPPRCQVEGCKVDLSDAKGYYSRHKVCCMHSKSSKVVVAGVEQRFCQQCSRFHQLSEFDQGKRSCRRRLAGHNERRRKPPPGSLFTTHYGSLSSSLYENKAEAGSFLMDFTKPTWRDQWTPTRASGQMSGNQHSEFVNFLPSQGQGNSEGTQPEIQHSATINFPGPGISSGGCFTGVSDSSCALSLLSNQPCNLRNQSSSIGANYQLETDSAHMIQPTVVHGANISHFLSSSWDYTGNDADGTCSLSMHSELGLGQNDRTGNRDYAGELHLTQQSGRPPMNHEHSVAYDSAQNMHWSV